MVADSFGHRLESFDLCVNMFEFSAEESIAFGF